VVAGKSGSGSSWSRRVRGALAGFHPLPAPFVVQPYSPLAVRLRRTKNTRSPSPVATARSGKPGMRQQSEAHTR
jgi:hypothetical protein